MLKIFIKYLFISISVAIYAAISISCTCSDCGGKTVGIPETVVLNANKFVESKVGKEFFENYFFFNNELSKSIPPLFELHYVFLMPEYDFVKEDIYFVTDSTGKVQQNYDILGIPNCADEPSECTFNVLGDSALAIASSKGMEPGVRPLDISFRWSAEYGKYVWHVLSTKRETGNVKSEFYKGEGEEMLIDPFSADILKYSEWKVR